MLLCLPIVSLTACDRSPTTPEARPPGAPAASTSNAAAESVSRTPASLTLVSDRSLVCMVNNQYMGRPQIPVAVEGRTYYGCCEMCKGRLAKDASARTAVDPVSGKQVDKASAVIARTAAGSIIYFENEANLVAYPKASN
jgi:YHS domain-containing protein